MVHAYRGVGKTHCSIGIGCAVASGRKFLNWEAISAETVLLIDGEMPAAILQSRLMDHMRMTTGTSTLPEKLRIMTPDLQKEGMPDIGMRLGQNKIEKFIGDDVKLVILDNLSTLMRTGAENEADSWLSLQQWGLRLRARGKSVLYIHHSGKNGSQRGSSRKEDVLDTVICLQHPKNYKPEQGACFEIHYEKARGLYGNDVKPFEARLMDGQWLTRSINQSNYDKAVALLKDGYTQRDIVEELGLSKGYISKINKKALAKGDLHA